MLQKEEYKRETCHMLRTTQTVLQDVTCIAKCINRACKECRAHRAPQQMSIMHIDALSACCADQQELPPVLPEGGHRDLGARLPVSVLPTLNWRFPFCSLRLLESFSDGRNAMHARTQIALMNSLVCACYIFVALHFEKLTLSHIAKSVSR